jgi:hypothetical protein
VRRWGLAALALGAAMHQGCSAPYGEEPCMPGFVRDSGPACTVPLGSVRIDGDESDWKSSGSMSMGGVRVARDARSLLFYIPTYGAPVRDGSMAYGIVFRRPDMMADDPKNSFVLAVVTGDLWEVQYNQIMLSGVPGVFAYTATGLELAIPFEVLPFAGQAYFNEVLFVWEKGAWKSLNDFWISSVACWDPSDPDNGCDSPL